MYYNLKSFGTRIKLIRKRLKLTQQNVSDRSQVNLSTIRRLEAGLVIPKLETLDYLSPVLKEDLLSIFMQYRIDDYYFFTLLKSRLENKLEGDDMDSLEEEQKKLADMEAGVKHGLYKNMIAQLSLLTEAAISYKKNKDPETALDLLIKAMRISTPDFSLDDYQFYAYSNQELRILVNIALMFKAVGKKTEHRDILDFCLASIETEDTLYPQVLYNLAGVYVQNRQYHTALDYTEKAIKWCQHQNVYQGLPLMFYNKGLCEYNLGVSTYASSFVKALSLCDIYDQPFLRQTILKRIKDLPTRSIFSFSEVAAGSIGDSHAADGRTLEE